MGVADRTAVCLRWLARMPRQWLRDNLDTLLIVMDSAPYGAVEGQINYLDYLRIIVKRRWLVGGVLSVCLAIALFKSLSETPMYKATATVQIERQVAKIVKGDSVMPTEIWDWEFLQTQLELLKSRSLAQRVVASLNLTEDFNLLGKDVSPFAKLRNQFSDLLRICCRLARCGTTVRSKDSDERRRHPRQWPKR